MAGLQFRRVAKPAARANARPMACPPRLNGGHGARAPLPTLRKLAVAEAGERHQHEQVGRAAGNILAFAAMALRLQHRLALGDIAQRAAIASAFEFHFRLPVPLSLHFMAKAFWLQSFLSAIKS